MPGIEILAEGELGELKHVFTALLTTQPVIGLALNIELVVDHPAEPLDVGAPVGRQVDFFAVVLVHHVHRDPALGVKPLDSWCRKVNQLGPFDQPVFAAADIQLERQEPRSPGN